MRLTFGDGFGRQGWGEGYGASERLVRGGEFHRDLGNSYEI